MSMVVSNSTNDSMSSVPGELLGLTLSPEDQLLVVCARQNLDADNLARVDSLFRQSIDWVRIIDAAAWHKLLGFFYRHLSAQSISDLVPKHILDQLRDHYRYTGVKQMYFRSELGRILAAMNDSSIDTVLMKGAALVDSVYGGDIGIRPMADLDILINPEQIRDAEKVSKELGYRSTVGETEQEKLRSEDRQIASMFIPGKPVILELHTHLVETHNPMRFDIEQLWDGTEEVTISGQKTLIQTPEYALATLAVNFMKDRRFYSYSSLGQLTDVAETIRVNAKSIDWGMFTKKPMFESVRGVTFCTLYLSKHLLGAAVPDSVINDLAPVDFRSSEMTRFVNQRVFGKTWWARGLGNGTGHFHWRNLPRLVITRLFSNKADTEEVSNSGGKKDDGNADSYIQRIWGAVILATTMIRNPMNLYRDVATDKWLHSMYHTSEYSERRNGRNLLDK